MRSNRKTSFDEFYGELETEAQAEGPEAMRDLRAKEVKYALINALITRRPSTGDARNQATREATARHRSEAPKGISGSES